MSRHVAIWEDESRKQGHHTLDTQMYAFVLTLLSMYNLAINVAAMALASRLADSLVAIIALYAFGVLALFVMSLQAWRIQQRWLSFVWLTTMSGAFGLLVGVTQKIGHTDQLASMYITAAAALLVFYFSATRAGYDKLRSWWYDSVDYLYRWWLVLTILIIAAYLGYLYQVLGVLFVFWMVSALCRALTLDRNACNAIDSVSSIYRDLMLYIINPEHRITVRKPVQD